MSEEYIGWHFLREDRRLGYGDGRGVVVGQTLTVPGPLELCEVGLHASARAIDALKYAPGPIACRVRLSGDVLTPEGEDKACATERTVVAMGNATEALRLFVVDTLIYQQPHVASLLAEAGLQTHADAVTALSITAETMVDAQKVFAAAREAAWDAAREAAWDAAREAAWDAAREAAWEAAWAAGRAAAWAAAWDAGRDAVREAARAAVREAARAAAREAAWDAARPALNERLEARLLAAVGLVV